MKYNLLNCLALIFLPCLLKAQQVTVNVYNEQSQLLPGSSIYVLNSNMNVVTGASGNTVFSLNKGKYSLQVSHTGYATIIQNISFLNDTVINVRLSPSVKKLDDVVVSTEKTEQDVQKVPLSITALSAADVADYKLWNTKQLTAIVPGMYVSNPGDNRNLTSIRGITTTSYDPAVATYIDGVNQFGLDTYIARLLDVERMEVLRGPQGSLYGRNSTGGIINIITRKPTNTARAFAEINAGKFGLQQYNAGFSLPVINNKLFIGASGMYEGRNGFYSNAYNNSKFDKQHSWMGNYFVKFLASDKLSFTLNAKHLDVDNNGPFQLVSGLDEALQDPFVVNQNATSVMRDKTFNASLSANYTGRALNFTSQTAYQNNYRYYTDPLDGDFSSLDAVSIINNYGHKWNNVKVGTQEFRFSSPSGNHKLTWLGGLYGFIQSSPVKQATHFGEDAAAVGSPLTDFSSINTNVLKGYGIAAYIQVSYAVTNKLQLTLGARYDYEHKKQNVEGAFQADGTDAVITQPDTVATAHFSAFSPRVSASYQLNEQQLVYATFSKGFRPGGISQLSSDPSQPPLFIYKPEHSNNYEIGLKNDLLDKKLQLNIAAFYTNITDAQVPTLILPDAITVTKNAGKLITKGVEAELRAKPVKGLNINYSFGYTDAHYTSLNIASNGEAVKLDGNKQVYTPDITSALAAQYSYAFSKTVTATVRMEWMYIGKQYFDLANQLKQSGYNLVNVQAGINISKLGFYVWGRNIFDKRYVDYAYDFGAAHLGDPAVYGVTLRVDCVFEKPSKF
ncbi:TonB-dependent receptor [Parafilimonas sp.]|uniref:TonB-dependent receptor n=1 Tax=Parafilimonas sp. TaxID=1969739 RepID=UPI0039E4B3B8